MLEAKLAGEEIARPEPVEEAPVVDLMEALRLSVAEVQSKQGKPDGKAKGKAPARSGRRPNPPSQPRDGRAVGRVAMGRVQGLVAGRATSVRRKCDDSPQAPRRGRAREAATAARGKLGRRGGSSPYGLGMAPIASRCAAKRVLSILPW